MVAKEEIHHSAGFCTDQKPFKKSRECVATPLCGSLSSLRFAPRDAGRVSGTATPWERASRQETCGASPVVLIC